MEDENFGVAELAEKAGMSRSNLLRRVQKISGRSVSVLIREVRLHHAKGLLQDGALNVSEISYKVGFNSTSYFTKCYRELYGYPPGEEASRSIESVKEENAIQVDEKRKSPFIFPAIVFTVLGLLVVLIFVSRENRIQDASFEKSIAVLPFKNDSNDSENTYFVNGLMEAVLNNLQKIENLRVVSRTSSEKYRDAKLSSAEISEELGVKYFVEGSGQKLGDEIILTIQLIEASSDKHLWSHRYARQATDIFSLQAEVAQDIAKEIEVIVTPEERGRIEKIPTANLTAYDYYLRGMDLTKKKSFESLERAIEYFEKALAEDEDFPHAYAATAICNYYLDYFLAKKTRGPEIKTLADKALSLDPELPESLIAKGLFYLHDGEYELAASYMERVLLYNPNSAVAYNFLSDIYNAYLPDTKKYLRYALKSIRLDQAGVDSSTTSLSYLHLANALAQTGFIEEADQNIRISRAYDPSNIFSEYVHAYIKLGQDGNFERTRDLLIETLAKDTTRLDVVQELAKIYYHMEDYDTAYAYYDKFVEARESFGMNIFVAEDVKIGFVMSKVGQEARAEKYFGSYLEYAEKDESIYRDLSFAAYYATQGEVDKGFEHLKLFSKQSGVQFWFILFMENDPIVSLLSGHPEYQEILDEIAASFWAEHREMRKQLEEEGLIGGRE